jgi:8-oxo-dGTP pyrophosphatase MutT (NUDIX family)
MRPGIKPNYAPCTNCGEIGHQQRSCIAPVSSYGVILFRIREPSWNPLQKLTLSESASLVVPMSQVEFCLVQRKDSIGLVELIRGKYKLNDIDYIREQISGMTQEERDLVKVTPFEKLWVHVWGAENKLYRNDFELSKEKFEQLQKGIVDPKDGNTYTLLTLLEESPNTWNTPEWGFPKGRRNRFESDQECAIRECCEETGLYRNQFHILQNLLPIRETFFGNNQIYYTHVYYLAWCPMNTVVEMKHSDEIMLREVGNIGWFSLEQSLQLIRPTNVEKREILLQASRILKNTCPIVLSDSVLCGVGDRDVNTILNQDERKHAYSFIDEQPGTRS